MTKIQLKRSSVLEGGSAKEPTLAQTEYGELCVNYNNADPAIFIRNSNDEIIRIAGSGSISSGEVPSGGTPPTNGNQVGDLFFDTTNNILVYWNGSEWEEVGGGSEVIVSDTAPSTTDLPEGTLWWNSDASDMQLYVLYNDGSPDAGLKWVEASPGGGGSGSDDAVVKNPDGNASQNIDGPLTIGPDGGPAVTTLAADGSASFDGNIDGKQITSSHGLKNERISGVVTNHIECTSDGFNNFKVDPSGIVSVGVNSEIILNSNGSASFAGDVTATGALTIARPTPYNSFSLAVFSNSTNSAGAAKIVCKGDKLLIGDDVNVVDESGSNILLNTDGSASFAGSVTGKVYGSFGTGTGNGIALYASNATTTAAEAAFVITNGASGGYFIQGKGSGGAQTYSVSNTGVVGTRGIVIETEADNPANYTTTTDSEGNETQVYNGPTLDVKERIQTAETARAAFRETFQELQVAVENATDFAGLKAAMLVALQDYAS